MRLRAPLHRVTAALAAAVLVIGAPSFHGAEGASKKKKRPPAQEPPPAPRPPDPYRVTLSTGDGVLLAGSFRTVPGRPSAPGVLLLHSFSRDRRECDDLVPALNALGLATLAIDLRGHGESVRKSGGAVVKLRPGLQTDPTGFPRDVEAAAAWLRQRCPRIAVLGLSLSGNLAAIATASGWAEAGVSVSAYADRLAALAGELPVRSKGLLVLASESDPGRADSARTLFSAGKEPRKLAIYPGTGHGLALFAQHPEARKLVLDWVVERLAPLPPVMETPTPRPEGPSTTASPPPGGAS